MDAVISARNLSKTYFEGAASVSALSNVNLDVYAGEATLFMGPSGSGKTTLISIMGCILRPTSGSVRIRGLEVTGLSEGELPRVRLDNFGFIFQGFNLFPTLTAGENVEVGLDLKGIRGTAAKRRAAALLGQVGLGEKYNTFPADLSGGQKQRVAIARALVMEPAVLLADEPTGDLDEHTAESLHDLLREMHRERGLTSIIATHNPRLAAACDRVLRLEEGKLREAS